MAWPFLIGAAAAGAASAFGGSAWDKVTGADDTPAANAPALNPAFGAPAAKKKISNTRIAIVGTLLVLTFAAAAKYKFFRR